MKNYYKICTGNYTAINNEQNPYHTASYIKPQNDICKTIQTRKLTAW